MEKKQVEISIGLVVKTVFILLALWFLFLVRDVLALFFFAFILTATLDPIVDWMERKKLSRAAAVSLVYVVLLAGATVGLWLMVPSLAGQIEDFIMQLPTYGERLTASLQGVEQYLYLHGIDMNIEQAIREQLAHSGENTPRFFSTTVNLLHMVVSFVVVLSLAFYMLVNELGMKRLLLSMTPIHKRKYVLSLFERIKVRIGKWLFGQILLIAFIFLLDLVVLTIFNVPYALVLALIAGVLEIVPYLGPVISALLAASVGFLISPPTGLLVLGIFTLSQQIESHIVVPQVMKKAVGLNPVAVILALLAGAKLGGTVGAVLSIPIATAVSVFVEDIVNRKME